MRFFPLSAALGLTLALCACSGADIQTSGSEAWAGAQYRFYDWQTAALPQDQRQTDPTYTLDPVIRAAIEEGLQKKGYVYDPERPDFKVRYVNAPGNMAGVKPEQASNISPIPQTREILPRDQASVDNAIALGGVKETIEVNITLVDPADSAALWTGSISMIVENVNEQDSSKAQRQLNGHVLRALKELPEASSSR